jgi:hypothetical protein
MSRASRPTNFSWLPSHGGQTGGPFDGRRTGLLAHQAIAGLLADGIRQPTTEQLLSTAALVSAEPAVIYRQNAVQRLVTASAVYFRLFAPPAAVALVGTEVRIRGACFDVVWELRDGSIGADEIKTGRVANAVARDEFMAQTLRQARAGQRRWGTRFRCVRCLLLGEPALSWSIDPDGAIAEAPRW